MSDYFDLRKQSMPHKDFIKYANQNSLHRIKSITPTEVIFEDYKKKGFFPNIMGGGVINRNWSSTPREGDYERWGGGNYDPETLEKALLNDKKIAMIKIVREHMKIGLREAKDLVEANMDLWVDILVSEITNRELPLHINKEIKNPRYQKAVMNRLENLNNEEKSNNAKGSMVDYTRSDLKREAKRILLEAIRYIDGCTVKPTPLSNQTDVMLMVADATGVNNWYYLD